MFIYPDNITEYALVKSISQLRTQLAVSQEVMFSLLVELSRGDESETPKPYTKELIQAELYKKHSDFTGIDFETNMSTGEPHVTKYARDGSVQRWKINLNQEEAPGEINIGQ